MISCCAMGRSVADETNASRIRRMRGEIGRFLCAVRAVAGFLAVVPVLAAGFCVGVLAPDWSGSVFGGGVLGAVGACLSGESEAAGLEDCCANAHTPTKASTHHHLRPSRTTLV